MDYLVVSYAGSKIKIAVLTQGESSSIAGAGGRSIDLTCAEGGVRVFCDGINRIFSAGETVDVWGGTLAVFEKRALPQRLSLAKISEIKIGRSSKNEIRLREPQVSSSHAMIKKIDGAWHALDAGSRNGTFVDGRRIGIDPVKISDGASIFIGGFIFEMISGELRFANVPGELDFSQRIVPMMISAGGRSASYPNFYRSPRIRSSEERVDVEVLPPPNAGTKPSVSWLSVLLPPSLMVAVMSSVAMITGNFMMMLYTVPMSGVSVMMAVINHKSKSKNYQQTLGQVQAKYAEHLRDKEAEITSAESACIASAAAASPGVRECVAIARDVRRRLWERTPFDADFLSVRIGTGRRASNAEIKIPREQLVLEENPLLKDAASLKDRHSVLDGVPICHSFIDYPITGIVGKRDEVQRTAMSVIAGIAVHHSYEDVKIVCVFPEEEREQWDWIRWLPHAWNGERTRRSISCTADKTRPMLRELAETLKIRRREQTDQQRRDGAHASPFYFLILADKALTECSGEQFFPETSSLGFAALYAYGDIGALPMECQAIINCGTECSVQITADPSAKRSFVPDAVRKSWMDELARALAPVRLRTSGATGGMPTYIPFLQGLGVRRVEELNVLDRWERGHPFKSIAAPIGIKENGDVFYFDIHEKGMGPHGIAAGATRWGKSETLTTWLLSVALHYRPDEVSFVLIDFKGDGLSGILMDLPHVAGVISNVDDITSIERNLRSLRGELIRRQRVFKDTKLENIHKYQETRRSGRADLEAMPYLIVVIDEFAELKTQFPEQMDEFISIARVGGSLGVYMVLATQSPGGIVAGQVSANSRFRICLKTAEAGESKEILGTTDAFRITVRGRAYIKVGNNEVYEQVQTFYSKAPYRPDASSKGPSTEINIVELNGERVRPDKYDKTIGASAEDIGEGRAVSSYIRSEAQKNDMPFARPVWTEALPKRLYLSELLNGREAFRENVWATRNSGLSVIVGRVDDPEEQCQYPFVLDFMRDGHQILYGAPSSGKTTFLQTAIISAAQTYTPDQLHFLVLDFGNWGMKIFEALPHTLMVADADDKEKMKKAEEYMLAQIELRKRLFAAEGVGTLDAYREVTGRSLPVLLIGIDNMAALYNQYPDMMDSLIQVAREGGGLGVYLIVTAGNPGSFMYRIAQYVKSNHALLLTDRSDYRALVGGTGRQEPTHVAGRGFTRGPLEFQTALCASGASEGERVRALREICTAMREAWHGERASLEEAESKSIDASELSFSRDWVEIGIDKTTKEPYRFEFEKMNGCVITGAEGSGKSNALSMIARALSKDVDTTLYIYEKNSMLSDICSLAMAAHDTEDTDAMISILASEYDRRSDGGSDGDKRLVLCIDDFSNFFDDVSDESITALDVLIRCGSDYGIYVFIAGDLERLERLHSFRVRPIESCISGGHALIIGGRLKDNAMFGSHDPNGDIELARHEACVIDSDTKTVITMALVRGEAHV